MSEPVFLALDQVKALHRMALERHGSRHGVRGAATLEGAVIETGARCFPVLAADSLPALRSQAKGGSAEQQFARVSVISLTSPRKNSHLAPPHSASAPRPDPGYF